MKKWRNKFGKDKNHIKDRAILIYYLGGAPLSYYLYDEIIDNGEYVLSARDYYYYTLNSKIVGIDLDEIANSALCSIKEDDDISEYYKGQIYCIINKHEEALSCFAKAKNFKYAQIMYNYLKGLGEFLPEPPKQNIDPDVVAYEVFDDYYYYHECYIAFRGFYHTSRIYYYFLGDKTKLQNTIKAEEAEIVVKKLYTDLRNRSVSLSKEEYNRRIKMLDDLLLTKDGMVRRAKLETDEGIIKTPEKAEIQIALTIENFEIENIDFYALLIYNYYFRGFIDQRAVINLSFYVMAVAKCKLKEKVFNSLFDVGLSVSAVMLLCPFDLITHFKEICISTPLLAIVENRFNKDLNLMKQSKYEYFLEKLKLQELELKDKIGDENFYNQCRFITIVKKVYQLDEYISQH